MLYLFTAIGLFNLAFLTLLKLLFLPLVISGMYTVIWEDTVKKKNPKNRVGKCLASHLFKCHRFPRRSFYILCSNC